MNFPETLRIRLVEADSMAPVIGAAVTMTLRAPRKNDFIVGPSLTDASGLVAFSRRECESAIELAQRMFVMDYAGSLADCGPEVEIALQPIGELRAMIDQYENDPEFWGLGVEEPRKYFAALRSASNAQFVPASATLRERDLFGGQPIVLDLRRCRTGLNGETGGAQAP